MLEVQRVIFADTIKKDPASQNIIIFLQCGWLKTLAGINIPNQTSLWIPFHNAERPPS